MKSMLLSPQSIKQIKPISMSNKSPQIKDEKEGNYFHECLKNAKCNCKMCLESMSATLDLMPMSIQRSTLTKLSFSKPKVDTTPVSIDPTMLSTPISKSPPNIVEFSSSSSSKSVVGSAPKTGCEKTVRKFGGMFRFLKWVFVFVLIFGLEFGFSWVVPRVLRPELSREIVRDVVQECSVFESLSGRLEVIQNGLNVSVDGKISSCLLADSNWKVNQDGLILLSYCILYQSVTEEVLVLGSPLQTSGILTSGFSSRSFNVLSGKITEWHDGNIIKVNRDANTTWFLRKWSSSIVQFEPNTWMIEYRRNSLLENPSMILIAVKFTKLRISIFMQRLKQHFWYMLEIGHDAFSTSKTARSSVPT